MTSSARNRIDLGTSMPSAFAVFRLTTSSNVVGCSTGRSAGFSALEDFVNIDGSTFIKTVVVRSVRHQTSRSRKAPRSRYGNEACFQRKVRKPPPIQSVSGVHQDDECL